MMPSGAQNSEHLNSASSSDDSAKFSILRQHFTHYNDSSSGPGFPLGSLQQQDNAQHQPSGTQNPSMLHSRAQTASPHVEPHQEGGEASGYNNYHQGFPFSVGQGFSSNYGGHDDFGILRVPEPPPFSATSPEALLNTLSVIQQKVQQLQAVVQLMAHGGGPPSMPQQQQALAAGITSVISQLVVATAGLLQPLSAPSTQLFPSNPHLNRIVGGALGSNFNDFQQGGMGNPLVGAFGNSMGNALDSFCTPNRDCSPIVGGIGTGSTVRGGLGGSEIGSSGLRDLGLGGQSSANPGNTLGPTLGNTLGNNVTAEIDVGTKGSPGSTVGVSSNHGMDGVDDMMLNGSEAFQPSMEDHDSVLGLRDDEEDGDGENLPPGSYELVEMDAAEILAEHTHFCEICGKGFKRDANLRMHMRGHGDEYKTPAALARPDKSNSDPSTIKLRRYSCPFVGCKRNKKHRKFQPLKTMLCVKNHYRRSHCPKILTCNKCKTKKFSVVADLKTHEKHCGRDKWQCSCGTTFSRKDKLFGHIGLFAGHTPALTMHEMENPAGGLESASKCFTSGNGEGLEGMSCNESVLLGAARSNTFTQENGPALMVARGRGMDIPDESSIGTGMNRNEGLQTLRPRDGLSHNEGSRGAALGDASSPSSSFGGTLVSNSSMMHGLLSGNFLHHADGNN